MRKLFALSAETQTITQILQGMRLGQEMSFAELSKLARFPVTSSSACYQAGRRIAERDHGVYIASVRGVGFVRGTGDDMADSLEPLAKRMRRAAKKSVERADLAVSNNLSEERYHRTVERRNRASIIYSTTAAPMPKSNRSRQEPSTEAPRRSQFDALKAIK